MPLRHGGMRHVVVDIVFNHNVVYTTHDTVSVEDIARSLLATEQLVQRLPRILERLFPDLDVVEINLELLRLERGSLIEDWGVKIAVHCQERLEAAIERVAEKNSIEMLEDNKKLISYLIIGLVIVGGGYAISLVFPDKKGGIHIEGNSNVVFSAAGDMIGMRGDDVRKIVEETIAANERRKLAKESANVLAPAHREPGAGITSSGGVITPAAIRETPSREMVERIQPEETSIRLESVEIQIRATDRDSGNKGWGAVIPQLGVGRIPLKVMPGIDLDDLAGIATVIGDIIVLMKIQGDGSLKPSGAHLYALHPMSKPDTDLKQP